MSQENYLLLSNQNSLGDFISEKSKASGYHNRFDNLHTFTISFSNWSGQLKLQGTLRLYPNDSTDWVDLKDTDLNTIFFEESNINQSVSVNSSGNFLWLRAIGRTDSGSISEIRYFY